jgi:hypothetical protein
MSALLLRARREPAGGFVLVGVVMMVLALTIIGLSLYSLSGYESQFFGRSLFDRQALYTASGGVELAKNLLATRLGSPAECRLANVSRAIGREGIVSALAWQDSPPDSVGAVDWSQPVHIRVGVQVNGVARTLQGTFTGSETRSPYHCVFTCPGEITTNVEGNNRPLALIGSVWQTIEDDEEDTEWRAALDPNSNPTYLAGPAPSPAVDDYFAIHAPDATPVKFFPDTPDSTNFTLTLDARSGPGEVRYFSAYTDSNTASTGYLPFYDVYSQRITHLKVAGTAVWLLPGGTHFEGEFRVSLVSGATTGTLVLVVGPNGRVSGNAEVGPWFEKGIQILPSGPNAPRIFLVTDGTARIHDNIQTQDIYARGISVFASRIEFQGPHFNMPRDNMWLEYRESMKAIANTLRAQGVLPGTLGIPSGQFTLAPGSWTSSPGLQ